MSNASPLKPAARLFACEYEKCRFETISPGLFIVGVLTDKITRGGKISSLRVSDPTGVFSFTMDWQNAIVMEAAEKLDVPSFAAVYAKVERKEFAGKIYTELVPATLCETTRAARDAWIQDAAQSAPARLANNPKGAELLEKIDAAYGAVKPKAPAVEISNDEIFETIENLSEKKGAPIQKVLEALTGLGLSEAVAKARLNQLMEDGDLYSPTKETIKVL